MFQRLCDSAAKLGSTGDVAGTRPILKELQAVLQRWDYETSEDQCGKLWHTTPIIFKIRRRKKSQITETTITCMLLQGHKINVETEQKPIDNRIHHECCRKEALNPVIVTKCLRAMMKYYRSLTHFWCETTSRNLLDQCCGVTVTSTRSGGHYKTLLTVIKLAALNKKMCSHSVAAL